jgi:endonuclease YncB( thermonuclease family)
MSRRLSNSPGVALAALLSLLLATAVLGQGPVMVRGKVVGISDGDTIKVLVVGRQLIKVRIAFVDSPEMHQAFGYRAKQAMSELVFGKDVELRPHTIDRYRRVVAQVFVDGKDAGLEMLRLGLAWVYERYITEASDDLQARYREAQEEARAQRSGLWEDPAPLPPWQYRRQRIVNAAPGGQASSSPKSILISGQAAGLMLSLSVRRL